MVADALQKHGIKRTARQKVMDTLATNGKILFEDYGKRRVCMADQTQFEIPDIDELDAMKKQNDQLQADVAAVRSHVSELAAGVKSAESNLTLDAVVDKTKKLGLEVAYDLKLGLWRRKKMYHELWGMITESMTENLGGLKEEIGIDTDEDVGCNITDIESRSRTKESKHNFTADMMSGENLEVLQRRLPLLFRSTILNLYRLGHRAKFPSILGLCTAFI